MDEAARAAHIAGVTSNLHQAQAAAQALGDIPPILSAPNFLEHGPDEKAVIIFVSFLCARVLEVSKEDRAAQVIQQWYRQRRAWRPGLHSPISLCVLILLVFIACFQRCQQRTVNIAIVANTPCIMVWEYTLKSATVTTIDCHDHVLYLR